MEAGVAATVRRAGAVSNEMLCMYVDAFSFMWFDSLFVLKKKNR